MIAKTVAALPPYQINLAYRCNNLCRFCLCGDARTKLAEPSLAQIKSSLKKNAAPGRAAILTGGEPTLRKDLPEIVRHARGGCGYATVEIRTNGRLAAYSEYAAALAASGASHFLVAAHGHRPALHDWLTGQPGSFAETMLGIMNLLEAGCNVATNTVITKSNYLNLPDIAKALAALGVRRMRFTYPVVEGKAKENELSIIPAPRLIEPFVRLAAETAASCGAAAEFVGFPEQSSP